MCRALGEGFVGFRFRALGRVYCGLRFCAWGLFGFGRLGFSGEAVWLAAAEYLEI